MMHQIRLGFEGEELVVQPVPPTYEVVPDAMPEGIHPRAYEHWPNTGSTLIRVRRPHAFLDFQQADIVAMGEYEVRSGNTSRKVFLVTFSKNAKPLLVVCARE